MDNEAHEHIKEQLETRKLTLEIEDLQKPLYFKASFYAAGTNNARVGNTRGRLLYGLVQHSK